MLSCNSLCFSKYIHYFSVTTLFLFELHWMQTLPQKQSYPSIQILIHIYRRLQVDSNLELHTKITQN